LNTKNIPWRVNEQIRAAELRVIDSEGQQIGVLPFDQALQKAREEGVDLIEVVPKANPPVAKIIELGKFRYQEEKKAKEAQKKAKAAELKEIRFSPFIAEGDYQTRLIRVKEFLVGGDKVKLVVVFKGRQLGSKQFGYDLFKKILAELKDTVVVDMEPKFIGRHLAMIVSPLKKKIANIEKEIKDAKKQS
jgi:translation initiation factor IF-3